MIKRSRLCRSIFWSVIALLYIPIIVLAIMSFNASRFGGSWEGFSLEWYSRLFKEPAIWNALTNSLIAASTSSFVATLISTAAALSLYTYKSRLQNAHMGLIVVPLFIPDILMGMSLLVLFVFLNIKLSLFTVFLAHTTFSISYVTMIIKSRLETLDNSILEAAKDLGASSRQVFTHILLPYIMPSLVSGFLLAFTLSLDDFVITFFVVGPGATTLPIYVYSMMKFGSPPVINALSTVLLGFTGLMTLSSYHLTKDTAVR